MLGSAELAETSFYTCREDSLDRLVSSLSPVANWSSSLGTSPARARGSSRDSMNMVRVGSGVVRFRTVIRKEVVMDPGIGVMGQKVRRHSYSQEAGVETIIEAMVTSQS